MSKVIMMNGIAGDKILFKKLASGSLPLENEIEAWVVNTVKVKMIKRLDNLLEREGRSNARRLFLVPIFTIPELAQRIETQAPEIKTLFYKELVKVVIQAENRSFGPSN